MNKYGKMILNYLEEYKKAEYTIMFMENTLINHLEEIQETATKRIDLIIDDLKAKSNITEDMKNTDMLYWIGTMNTIKQQAEEIIKLKNLMKNLQINVIIKPIIEIRQLRLPNLRRQ